MMKICDRSKILRKEGSALLTALLIMGILIAVSLATSMLIVREVGLTKLTLDAGKAFYGAESGVEVALLQIEENLPGYEVLDEVLEVDEDVIVEYSIANKANVYPYFGDEFKLESVKENVEALYDVLELNESITIPLFTVNDEGKEVPVEAFRVQYFVKFDPQTHLAIDAGPNLLSGWDVLRWKIFGVKTDSVMTGAMETESINDFTAVTVSVDTSYQTDAKIPTWFGSVDCDGGDIEKDGITCADYDGLPAVNTSVSRGVESYFDDDSGQYIYNVICSPIQAREFYAYEDGEVVVKPCYNIKDFLVNHDFNYLTLTNMMNPAVFDSIYSKDDRMKLSRLYFRVEVYDGDGLVREYASISSVGASGDSKIALDVKKRRGYYLQVMNFALYHTKDAVEGRQ